MKNRTIITFGLSALVLGGAMAGHAGNGGIAVAGVRDAAGNAAKQIELARKNLARGRAEAAVEQAERAVGYAPLMADYRVVLGQAYLKAGRFGSARTAFGDALALEPGNGKAALHLALTEIGEGDWEGARQTLDAHAATIAVRDRGLAMALAGDPVAAVALLDGAARAPDADAKTRQNYALALALAGRWADARTVAAIDVGPDLLDARMLEWARFAKPTSASDQVANLLGVTPVLDPGQPMRLALHDRVAVLATTTPIDAYMPGAQAAHPPEAQVETADVVEAPPPAGAPVHVSFAARREVVQMLPPRPARAVPTVSADIKRKSKAVAAKPAVTVTTAARMPGNGDFFVQLGAFDNADAAQAAWRRLSRKHGALAGKIPSGVSVRTKAGAFYRLSVGGFARSAAVTLCQNYKTTGGACFVRADAGDKVAAWVTPGAHLASR
ncbi:tetratricopeptide repeat protein [Sphingomonas qilianensis]|uniref:Tetratricopeptide repeat protein n=1 Tax=Sphingomonas qilianensis TaxID=1736690 RepID=A0ABU9XS28_9SPHN